MRLSDEERALANTICPGAHKVFEENPSRIPIHERVARIIAKLGDSQVQAVADPDDNGRYQLEFL